MPDMSKSGAHLESLLETLRFKQIDHYRQSKEHALKGDMYQEFAAELRHALDCEKDKAAKDRKGEQ
jgi:hypothetical protein